MPGYDPQSVDWQIAKIIKETIKASGMYQMTVAERAGMKQPRLSVCSNGGSLFKVDELDAVCGVLGLDVAWVFAEAQRRAEAQPPSPRHHSGQPPRDDDELRALGRQIAANVWAGCADRDFVRIMLNEEISYRSDHWTDQTIKIALGYALWDIADALHARFPYLDAFPKLPLVDWLEIKP